MYTAVLKHAYLPLVHRLKKTTYPEALREALANQRKPRAELERLTVAKLRALVEHAEHNCPYYAQTFRAAGVAGGKLDSLADFRAWPRLSKAEVHDHASGLKSPVYPGKAFSAVTSGSTGVALRFEQDSLHVGWVDACMDRGHGWWGLDPSDRRVVLWGRPVAGGRRAQARQWVKHRLRNILSFNTFEELTDEFLGHIADSIVRFKPKLIYGYASSIAALAEYMDKRGLVLTGDRRPPHRARRSLPDMAAARSAPASHPPGRRPPAGGRRFARAIMEKPDV